MSAPWPNPFTGDELSGKVALVTGAAQGIGAAIAAKLGELGARVAVTDLNEEGAEARAKELYSQGIDAAAFALDVRSTEMVDAVASEVAERLGPIEVLINNAGLFELTETTDVPDEEWELQIGVMLSGPFKLARRVARDMLQADGGAIVGTCSIGGFGGHPQRTAYNAAKGGLRIMTECLATEWAPRGIRVNAVAPAVTRTEILQHVLETAGGKIKVDEYASRTPLGRIAETEEIANCVAFLASPRSSYVTGEVLPVDGGWLASDGFPHEVREGAPLSESTAQTIAVGPDPLVGDLVEAIGVEAERADAVAVARGEVPRWSGDSLVWLHLVPARERPDHAGPLAEADLLLASARGARRVADGAGARLTFLALLPSRGLLSGEAGLACDLARGAFEGLMQAEIDAWSAAEARIAGIHYAGIEGHELPGQREVGEVRDRTPVHALASVPQIADAIRFLGSDRASYVTGTHLHVDGGWNAYSWIYPARTI